MFHNSKPISPDLGGKNYGCVCFAFFQEKIYFFLKIIHFEVLVVFVVDFLKNHFLKRIIFNPKCRNFLFLKLRNLSVGTSYFKKKKDFYDYKQTQNSIRFF
jgi:hypothetical protein